MAASGRMREQLENVNDEYFHQWTRFVPFITAGTSLPDDRGITNEEEVNNVYNLKI